jgi:hypothetical protein
MAGAPAASGPETPAASRGKPAKGVLNRPPVLGLEKSAELRDGLLAQLASLSGNDDLLGWPTRLNAAKWQFPAYREFCREN